MGFLPNWCVNNKYNSFIVFCIMNRLVLQLKLRDNPSPLKARLSDQFIGRISKVFVYVMYK